MTPIDAILLGAVIVALILAGDNYRLAWRAIRAAQATLKTAEEANKAATAWRARYMSERFTGVPRKNIGRQR